MFPRLASFLMWVNILYSTCDKKQIVPVGDLKGLRIMEISLTQSLVVFEGDISLVSTITR